MILDNQTLLSDQQEITTSAGSANVIDLGPIGQGIVRDIGKGTPIPILVQVTENFAADGEATLTVSVQVDDNATFSSPKTVISTGALALADLKAGYQINLDYVPRGTDERYMRLNYTVGTGPMTAGKVHAGILWGGHQTNG